ncbi:cytosine deaminase [Allobacillus sp. GCM10007491]|uniref:Cytosine deaminase n=1 Tax=Allobacillus saliphilus TaxID=2912308 RepID=A0A941HT31_9BACI|nr:cytosine deaminase [Allobacillus saliphilus]MBR7554018.1 cytosine deaminase [Allobacillus saliphilus]
MLLTNAKLYGQEGRWDIEIQDGRFKKISTSEGQKQDESAIDLKGKIVLPPYVEPHIHLDYALTAGTPRWNQTGSVFEGIEIWAERKQLVDESIEDIKQRAKNALKMQIKHGIQHVRTHVDVGDPELKGMKALLEVKEEIKPWVDLQLVAMPQEGLYTKPDAERLLIEAIEMGADVIGGIPHYELTREDGVRSVHRILELAEKYDKLVDVHCDEIDDDQSRYLEVLAGEALKRGIGHRVTASHTTAMASYSNAYTYKLFQTLKKAGIHFVALPKANLHLQGRFDDYPVRRGLTRVKEMLHEGINVSFGLDSIMDPWYPLGDGNLMHVTEIGLHACHMTDYDHIVSALNLITINGAKTLGIEELYGIEQGNKANLIVIDSESEYEAIRTQAPVLYSIREGEIIVETKPAETKMNIEMD